MAPWQQVQEIRLIKSRKEFLIYQLGRQLRKANLKLRFSIKWKNKFLYFVWNVIKLFISFENMRSDFLKLSS